ncbi:hypothetical protein R3P38DRAFT_3185253 [Favolaschia claudopus]|uniref:Uncharacterized protein n=1 Tax=Favolaschia claudopus TaxID=2862362 RepID=A0AAW0C6P4_9AGAR
MTTNVCPAATDRNARHPQDLVSPSNRLRVQLKARLDPGFVSRLLVAAAAACPLSDLAAADSLLGLLCSLLVVGTSGCSESVDS